jgi:membrane protease subunit (stomatin/prohibitin family)
MALIDRVKYDADDDSLFVWKYPSESLVWGTQVIVNQSQQAIFVKGGEALDVLEPGTHTLSTGNIPLLNKLINIPFGGNTPFTAEVWYVNQTVKRDMKWGTPHPIQLMDPSLNFPVSVRAFGRWGVRVDNPRAFVSRLVGSQVDADATKVHEYFIGEINQKLNATLSVAMVGNRIGIFNISAMINELSELASTSIKEEFWRFGIELINFNIESISIPAEEMAKVQEVLGKKMEAEQLSQVSIGGAYAAIKSFDILNKVAENPGEGGGLGTMLGAGIGIGAGLPIGQQIGQQMQVSSHNTNGGVDDLKIRLNKLQKLLDANLITPEEFAQRREKMLAEI